MSGLGVVPWSEQRWNAFETMLLEYGWQVEHCAHCDRSNRHPSCCIVPVPGQEQRAIPIIVPQRIQV